MCIVWRNLRQNGYGQVSGWFQCKAFGLRVVIEPSAVRHTHETIMFGIAVSRFVSKHQHVHVLCVLCILCDIDVFICSCCHTKCVQSMLNCVGAVAHNDSRHCAQ